MPSVAKNMFENAIETFKNLANGILTESGGQMLVSAMIIIVVTGFFGGLAAKKIKQPLVLGYIIAGVFVGAVYKVSFSQSIDAINSLASIGVGLLLFSMGLEFSKGDIKPIYKVAVWGTLSQVCFTLLLGGGIAYILNVKYQLFDNLAAMFLFGAAFVSTSTAVLIKTLSSKGRMGTLSSKVMIGMSIVQDLTVIPMMLIVGRLNNLADGIIPALAPIAKGAVFMVIMLTLGAKYVPLALKHVAKAGSKELFLLAVTGVALLAGAVSDMIGISFSFGAFLAGIVLSDSDYGKKALCELMPVRDLFAMLFFVSIGMMLELDYLKNNFALVLALVIIMGLSRTLFLALVTYSSGYRNVIPVAMFFGMGATSEIAFVVIQHGRAGGIFGNGAYSLILSVAVCSMIASPIIDNLTSPVYAFLKRTLWRNRLVADDIVLPKDSLYGHIIIAGGGLVARASAQLFAHLKLPYVLVEPDHDAFITARREGLQAIFGDPRQELILNAANVKDARIFLAASTEFEDNSSAVKAVRDLNPGIPIITRADTKEEVEVLRGYKVFEIVQAKFEAALEMTRQALLSLGVPSLDIRNYTDHVRFQHYSAFTGENLENNHLASAQISSLVELNWVCVPQGSPFAGKTLAGSRIRAMCGVSIVGVLRNGRFISNPPPDFILENGDTAAAIGTADQRKAFEKMMDVQLSETPAAAEHIGR